MADLKPTMAIRFAKAALILVGTATTLITGARLAVPYCLPLFGSFSSFRGVWIAAQLIIFLVWKLSDSNWNDDRQLEEDKLPVVDAIPIVTLEESDAQILSAAIVDELPRYSEGVPESAAALVLVMESGEPPSPEVDDEKPRVIPPSFVLKEPVKLQPAIEAEEEHDLIDSKWKAIVDGWRDPVRRSLKKSETWERPIRVEALARQQPVAGRPELRKSATFREVGKKGEEQGWRGREVLSVGRDELFSRVEAFIKMHHDNLRLQRQKSEQQRRYTAAAGIVNHAY